MEEERYCAICGRNGCGDPLDLHHIFGGAYRKKSEKYGLCVYLCHNRCHIFGEHAVHNDPKMMLKFRRIAQRAVMKSEGWSIDDFRREFGMNYLDEEG